MKKLLLSIGVLSAIIACSSDDDSKPVETYIDETEFYNTITVSLSNDCPNGEQVTYCLNEDEYMRVFNLNLPACEHIEFEDVDGVERHGYKLAMNTTNENGCLRNR